MEPLILYSYCRSSAAYRVRIALNLKGLRYVIRPVHLLRDGGQQHDPEYRRLNPQELVPTLLHNGRRIAQSLAIIDYLEQIAPQPPLLPPEPETRARILQLAQLIACDIHPLNNLRILRYLRENLEIPEQRVGDWYRHWIAEGFSALETLLQDWPQSGPFCQGSQPSLADICLVPQVYNARRYGCELGRYPRILAVDGSCASLEPFRQAAPENQPDFSSETVAKGDPDRG